MIRILFCVVLAGMLSVFCMGAAGAFHGTALICNKCHTMHYSEDGGVPPGADPGGPFGQLLTKEHSTELCLTCHDGQVGTPDVSGADVNALTERSAGHFAAVDVANANGHNLGQDKIGSSSLCVACHFGGEFSTAKLGCTDCHDAHGRVPGSPEYRYRNLQWASSPGSEPIITAFVNSGATGLDVYERDNVGYPAPSSNPSTWREVNNVCIDCHHTFSGYYYTRDPNHTDGTCIRHPNTESERGAWEAINKHTIGTDPAHWVDGTGIGFSIDRLPFIVSGATNYAQATTVAPTNEVFCLTCHKAHGNGNSSGLRWSYEVDSNAGCQQCHAKGD